MSLFSRILLYIYIKGEKISIAQHALLKKHIKMK